MSTITEAETKRFSFFLHANQQLAWNSVPGHFCQAQLSPHHCGWVSRVSQRSDSQMLELLTMRKTRTVLSETGSLGTVAPSSIKEAPGWDFGVTHLSAVQSCGVGVLVSCVLCWADILSGWKVASSVSSGNISAWTSGSVLSWSPPQPLLFPSHSCCQMQS